jgi:hypothetical protein
MAERDHCNPHLQVDGQGHRSRPTDPESDMGVHRVDQERRQVDGDLSSGDCGSSAVGEALIHRAGFLIRCRPGFDGFSDLRAA